MVYQEDAKLTEMGEKLKAKHHGKRLAGVDVLYFLRDEPVTKGGKKFPARAYRPNSFVQRACAKAYGTEPHFIVEVWADVWTAQDVSDKHRKALVDQELTRCGVDETEAGEMRTFIRPYDFQGFREVLARHGSDWDADLKQLVADVRQLKLFDDKEDAAA